MIAAHKYVTRQKLKEELHAKQIIDLSNSTLGHLLKHLGFKFKRDSGRRYIMEKPDIVSKRIKFLRQYTENLLSETPLDVVFIDETWIFQNGSDIRTWHDDNIKSVFNAKQSDGKRYIVLHAGTKDGFIDGADLVFSTKNKSADYHDNMNSTLFEKWLEEQLLPRLEKPSLLVIDNAKYHSRLSENVPNASTRKADIISWLQSKNINFMENALKPELLQIVKQYKAKLGYAVDELICTMGHQVLRLPPYHCIFNAIELIWAQSKTFFNKEIIGKDRKDENAVLDVWKEALQTITPENWSDCVSHTNNIIKDYWQKEHILDVQVKPLIIHVSDSGSDSESDISLSSDSD